MVTDPDASCQPTVFSSALRSRARAIGSWLCVGLDPDLRWMPAHVPRTAHGVVKFCTDVIDSTAESAACFKINFAFFEALGSDGWQALAEVRHSVPPGVPVIADAKRGDIGNTDLAYAEAILDVLDFGAVTVSPYLGADSVLPFASRSGKCALVLCKTSNPGASDFQDLNVDGLPFYMHVARRALSWEVPGEIGLVVGATQPASLRRVRALAQDVLLLLPGVGAQGAAVADAIRLGGNDQGENALIAVSRQILCASGGSDYAIAAGREAAQLAAATRAAQ